ncbi:MAG: DNA photolyase family protein [Cyanobacteria bacterium]|nr:DNA photolyase family protein [Cyanobacteriota bacterium]
MASPSLLIHWFWGDLRLAHNHALSQAAQAAIESNKPLIAAYILDPDIEPLGGASRWWLHHSLKQLEKRIADLDGKLFFMKGPIQACFDTLISKNSLHTVSFNQRPEPRYAAAQQDIANSLRKRGIPVIEGPPNLMLPLEGFLNKQGQTFQVFTPFWKAALASSHLPFTGRESFKPNDARLDLLQTAFSLDSTINPIENSCPLDSLGLRPKIHWTAGLEASWLPGETGAMKLLESFAQSERLQHYSEQRDFPHLPGTSRLSAHLHFGEITPQQIWARAASEPYQRQLGWREFAHQLLHHFPHTQSHPLRSEFLHFPWRDDATGLKAWRRGETGYPIVDAGMRELWATGWMHNRVRMIVGSFLVKDLLLPWQSGAEWFWDTLVDADLANNTMGWQWISGCGADAAPYFRIFNPMLQSVKFDPDGEYIRKWCPELSLLPKEYIHQPWLTPPLILANSKVYIGKNYPSIILDHHEARERALMALKKSKQPASIEK